MSDHIGAVCSDPWCPEHAVCGACGGPVIILEGDPAFCESCGGDVMPRGGCLTVDMRRGEKP